MLFSIPLVFFSMSVHLLCFNLYFSCTSTSLLPLSAKTLSTVWIVLHVGPDLKKDLVCNTKNGHSLEKYLGIVQCPEGNNKTLCQANTFPQDLSWIEARPKYCVHKERLLRSLSQGEETWAGPVPYWNLPHRHLPEPKPHSGSLESRVEWQHFLHPFRLPQYGKHLDLLKKKSQVVHWLCWIFFFLVVFWVNASLVKETFYLWTMTNWKQKGSWLDTWLLQNSSLLCISIMNYIKFLWKHPLCLWKSAAAIVCVVWLCAKTTKHDIYTNHYWTTI